MALSDEAGRCRAAALREPEGLIDDLGLGDAVADVDFDLSLLESAQQLGADLGVLVGDEPIGVLDDRDFGADGGIERRELDADGAGAADLTIDGPPSAGFAESAAIVPDLDGDGIADIAIGAIAFDPLDGQGLPINNAGGVMVLSSMAPFALMTSAAPVRRMFVIVLSRKSVGELNAA